MSESDEQLHDEAAQIEAELRRAARAAPGAALNVLRVLDQPSRQRE